MKKQSPTVQNQVFRALKRKKEKWRINKDNHIEYLGDDDLMVTPNELYEWLKQQYEYKPED
jgi:hypothetical protein